MRRKSNTAEAVAPEQSSAASPAGRPAAQPGEAERGGNGNAQAISAQQRPSGPVPVESMAQHKNAADLEDRIRRRAFEIYEARGRQDGHADEDWLLAEEEITGITGGG